MLLSAVSVLVVAQSISEIPDGRMNNSVLSSVSEIMPLTNFTIIIITIISIDTVAIGDVVAMTTMI
jgi:hypothetical protein